MAMSNRQVQRLLVSITSITISGVVTAIGISSGNSALALLAATVFLFSYFYFFNLLASAKGRSTLTGVVCGLLMLIGLVILTALPQKEPDALLTSNEPVPVDASDRSLKSTLPNREKRLLVILSLVLCFLVMFPPFLLYRRSGLKYGFLLSPPEMATVDVPLLLVELTVATFVGFVIWRVGK